MTTTRKYETLAGHEPSLWLRNEIGSIRRASSAGRLRQCGHLGPLSRAVIALWQPDTAYCGTCAPAVRLDHDWAADHTCDRCGTCAAELHACVAETVPALIIFGLCCDCYRREVPAA